MPTSTHKLCIIKCLFLLTLLSTSSYAFALDVSFVDDKWNGVTIPNVQQCQKSDGVNPSTPKLNLSDILAGSDGVVSFRL